MRAGIRKAFLFSVVDGKFPDINRVIPTLPRDNHATGFSVNASLMAKIEKAFGKNATVNILPGSELDGVLVEYAGKDEGLQGAIMVIMPIRSDRDYAPLVSHSAIAA